MRYSFFLLSTLLFCLLSSCTKENVSSFDDNFYQKWNVDNSRIFLSGVDTNLTVDWNHTDTTMITIEFKKDSYEMIISDPKITGITEPDTTRGKLIVYSDDLIRFNNLNWKINYLTNKGVGLENNEPYPGSSTFTSQRSKYQLSN